MAVDMIEVGRRTAPAVTEVVATFMLDGATYAAGAEAGYSGIDFYFAGRAGVLGEVEAPIVAAALVFFHPDTVQAAWDGGRSVLPRAEASSAFAACMSRWADEHLGDDVDWPTLAGLAGRIVAQASAAGAPVFAGWRSRPVPGDARHAAVHQLHCLRELRMARHAAAVIALGVDIGDAVWHRSPALAPFFGWPERSVGEEQVVRWTEAEAMTDRAAGRDYAVLDEDEAATFVGLCEAALSSARRS